MDCDTLRFCLQATREAHAISPVSLPGRPHHFCTSGPRVHRSDGKHRHSVSTLHRKDLQPADPKKVTLRPSTAATAPPAAVRYRSPPLSVRSASLGDLQATVTLRAAGHAVVVDTASAPTSASSSRRSSRSSSGVQGREEVEEVDSRGHGGDGSGELHGREQFEKTGTSCKTTLSGAREGRACVGVWVCGKGTPLSLSASLAPC